MQSNSAADKKISVLGATGSVGEQALDVAKRSGIQVASVSANRNVKRTEKIAREFNVSAVAMADPDAASELKIKLADTSIKVYSGENGICEMIANDSSETVVNSIIGKAGLMPTLSVIDKGVRLALANKESLVVAGNIVKNRAKEKNVEILPVDSEHCAIFQCLKAGNKKEIKKILLTASGGPFFGYNTEQLKDITLERALAHPTWKMGAKITIDSATLMNKGFEVIEAVHLFDVSVDQVEVVVHRESIIHSMVEYIDNSIIAQLSVPDMRSCVQYAVSYPERSISVIDELDLFSLGKLSFARPDMNTFTLLACAINSIKAGGALPAVLNASNEIAVDAFLNGKIKFYEISNIVCRVVESMSNASKADSLESILEFDKDAREMTKSLL